MLQAASTSAFSLDIYSFGHFLYEIALGSVLDTPTCDKFPEDTPDLLSKVYMTILKNNVVRIHFWSRTGFLGI